MNNKYIVPGILRNPITLLISMGVAVYFGLYIPIIPSSLKNVGDELLNLVKYVSIPLTYTYIIYSTAVLVKNSTIKVKFPLFLLAGFSLIIFSGLIGTLAGFVGEKFIFNKGLLGGNINEQLVEGFHVKPHNSTDIFSYYYSNILLLFFSVLIGAAIGMIRKRNREFLLDFFDSINMTLNNILSWITTLLPFIIIFISWFNINSINRDLLNSALSYLSVLSMLVVILLFAGILIIWKNSKQPFGSIFKSIFNSVIIGFTTGDSIIAIPYSVNTMSHNLKFDKNHISHNLPLLQIVGNFGNIILFSSITLFFTSFYSLHLSISGYLIVFITSIIAGVLSAGRVGVLTYPLLAISMKVLNLPLEFPIIFLVLIDFFVRPFVVILNIFLSMVGVSFVSKADSFGLEDISFGVLLQNVSEKTNLRQFFKDYSKELPVIDQKKSEFLFSVFPNAKFKFYKSFDEIETIWNSYDIEIIVGDKDYIKDLVDSDFSDCRYVVLNQKNN